MVIQDRAFVATHFSVLDQLDAVDFAVVFNAQAFAFDKFIDTFTLLAKESAFVGLGQDDAVLVAIGVFTDFNLGSAHHHGAFVEHSASCEGADLAQLVVHQIVSLDIHRLVAVCFFCRRRYGQKSQERSEKNGGEVIQGTNIAVSARMISASAAYFTN